MWFSTSSGRIELRLTREQAATGSHPGACDADVAHLRTVPAIRRQLDHGPYERSTLYGDGRVAARVAEQLARLDPYVQKRLAYVHEG